MPPATITDKTPTWLTATMVEYLRRIRDAYTFASVNVSQAANMHADLTRTYQAARATTGLSDAQLVQAGFPAPADFVWRPERRRS
jgi:hypothetical protein